jgi:hypothetical protein
MKTSGQWNMVLCFVYHNTSEITSHAMCCYLRVVILLILTIVGIVCVHWNVYLSALY